MAFFVCAIVQESFVPFVTTAKKFEFKVFFWRVAEANKRYSGQNHRHLAKRLVRTSASSGASE
jgi:hypothetical protein